MKRKVFVIMQSPDGEYPKREISLIEEGVITEQRRFRELIREGWVKKGTAETELTREELKRGIGFQTSRVSDLYQKRCGELEQQNRILKARLDAAERKVAEGKALIKKIIGEE